MTVIAWDGFSLAADKRATNNGLHRTVTKIARLRDHLVAVSGDYAKGNVLMKWFENGAIAADFPSFQQTPDWASLLVIDQSGQVMKYEQHHLPILFEDELYAMGSGRDYAMAALFLGKTAEEAVAVASVLDVDCGNGIDVLRLR